MSETNGETEITPEDVKIDPDEVEKEEQLMFGYGGGSTEPVELLSDYLPQQEDYAAKTVLTKEQVHLLAALDQLTTLFTEVDEYEPILEEWIKAYEKRLTSAHGLSRDEFVKILVSMNGGRVDDAETRGMLERVLDTDMTTEDS